ncbi:hypothetical protein FRC03_001071 [Tulasnella sp. 419]|nr:hypothetical protein FRC03_001071 [Tulasnella sp. 419]
MASPSVQSPSVEVLTGAGMGSRNGPIPVVASGPRRNTRSSLSKGPLVNGEDFLPSETPTPVELSVKALGKRKEGSNAPHAPSPLNPDTSKPPTSRKSKAEPKKDDAETKKRVMPMRQRRGGPGVGSSAVDMMIMESQRRTAENSTTLSPSAVFVLTTDSNFVATTSIAASRQRYFQKPEVVKACAKQAMIQTPDFERLTETSAVTGRLRARESDQQVTDDSDAAYERRHKKYETFEKRQRRREKEKLQHEQYKLKERIDELRSMDISAFGVGGLSHQEAEEKKRLMLKEAEELDRRYSILLPSEKKGISSKARKPGAGGLGGEGGDGTGTESRASTETDLAKAAPIRLRLKRGRISTPTTDDHPTPTIQPLDVEAMDSVMDDEREGADIAQDQDTQIVKFEHGDTEPTGSKTSAHPSPTKARQSHTSTEPSPKRRKLSLPSSGQVANQADGEESVAIPLILQFAQKSKSLVEPHAKRKLQPRHPLAFGVQMPPSVDTWMEFELPWYIVRDYENHHVEPEDVDISKMPGA